VTTQLILSENDGFQAPASRSGEKIRILHTITTLSLGGAEAMLYRLVCNTRHEASLRQCVLSLSGKDHYGPLLEAIDVPVFALELKKFPQNLKNLIEFRAVLKHWNPRRDSFLALSCGFSQHLDLLGVRGAFLGVEYTLFKYETI
jgi:hypothetical protein